MIKSSLLTLSLGLVLPATALSQGASFTEYGKGCPSSSHQTGQNSNTGAQALVTSLTNNPRWALEVPSTTTVIRGFEIFTQSDAKKNIQAWILLPDANGDPDHANPLATGTMTVDTKLGWYRVDFSPLAIVAQTDRFFISWDNGTGNSPLTADPNPRVGLFSPYMQGNIVGTTLTWTRPRALKRWAYRVIVQNTTQTPRVGTDTQPALGNSKFQVLLSQARGKTPAISILGESNSQWGPLKLPFELTPAGAPGCSLLASMLLLTPTVTDDDGRASFPLPIPNTKNLRGLTFYMQWMVADSSVNSLQFIFSNGAICVIGDAE